MLQNSNMPIQYSHKIDFGHNREKNLIVLAFS